ncbi:MAG TPA: hypothetical protein VM689_05820 [Aliidongia sp.]|nr:hypothetical protein [Aliidongia sp.]
MTKLGTVDTVSMPDQFDAIERTPGEPSGKEFTVLLAQVVGETAMLPHAVNKNTGAAGPFQFIKSTWLAMVRNHGAELGVKPELIQKIGVDAKGRPQIADPQALQDVLDLRHDVALSARMASKYTKDATGMLQRLLHRPPTDTEVHLTFLLGPAGASKLIHAAANTPEIGSDQVVTAAVKANPRLFHDASGRVRTAGEAVAFLADNYRANIVKAAIYAQVPAANPKSAIDA